jgi:hypothetical protein
MKQAVILILIMFTLNVFSQENKNAIMLVHQPQDLGLGLRYDRLFPNYGMYLSLTTGNYKLPYGGYIKDHHKIALGASKRAFTTRNTYLTIGLSYHHYGSRKITTEVGANTFNPVSLEFGATGEAKWLTAGFRFDPFKWEGCFDIGINF